MAERSKNPRAPTIPLQKAIEFGLQVYNEARLSTVDVDIAAVALGYKDSRNGAALTKLGTLKYYGILESKGKGKVRVSEEIQDYSFAPSQEEKWHIAQKFLGNPTVFKDILDQFDGNLPGDPVIKMFLLKEVGFIDPDKADFVLEVFRASLDFVASLYPDDGQKGDSHKFTADGDEDDKEYGNAAEGITLQKNKPEMDPEAPAGHDSIPIRLPRNRKAWLTIPDDFAESDKEVIKRQIDAIWVDE